MTEKEIILNALESGITLNKIYLEKMEYLYKKNNDDEKRFELLLDIKKTKRNIKTLEELKDQY